MTDSTVRDLPARTKVDGFHVIEAPGDEEQTGVGDLGAATKIQNLNILAVCGNNTKAVVRNIFAKAEVKIGKTQYASLQCGVQT